MMRPRQPLDPGSIQGTTDDEILQGFVASVRQWRGQSATSLAFRREDLVVLVSILGTDAETIERRLLALTGCNRRTAKRFRRLLLVSLAAVPLAATPPALPVLPLPANAISEVSASHEPEEARSTPVDVVSEPTEASPAPVVRVPVESPVASPAAPLAAPLVVPAPAPERHGSEVSVSISRLGIDLPVVGGGQEVIDQGVVAHYWAPGWREPAAAGAPGTYWLAAHRQTHGAPFRLLPEVVVGDRIDVATATATFTYVVTSTEVVMDDAGFGPVYGTDPEARVILLQTCVDDVLRLLVHGTLVAQT